MDNAHHAGTTYQVLLCVAAIRAGAIPRHPVGREVFAAQSSAQLTAARINSWAVVRPSFSLMRAW